MKKQEGYGQNCPWEERGNETQIVPFALRLAASLNRRYANNWRFERFFVPAAEADPNEEQKEILMIEVQRRERPLPADTVGDLSTEIEIRARRIPAEMVGVLLKEIEDTKGLRSKEYAAEQARWKAEAERKRSRKRAALKMK